MDFFYEDTRTGNRFKDPRPDLADIPALHLKRIDADGTEVKPKVSLPITTEKIKAAKAAVTPSAEGVAQKKADAPISGSNESAKED